MIASRNRIVELGIEFAGNRWIRSVAKWMPRVNQSLEGRSR